MSYFEYFTKNINQPVEIKSSANAQGVVPAQKPKEKSNKCKNVRPKKEESKHVDSIKGTCLSMCPEDEVKMREKVKLIHVLEVIEGKKVLVKCYSRSAADSQVAVPRLLRPYNVLRDTVHHLLFSIVEREDVNAAVVYDFVSDRLRAVRQDMTVQRLHYKECVTLLEPMIRFHVYFAYKLCEYPTNVYDPILNKKLLLECLKWFLNCCDSMDQTPEDLASDIAQLNINPNYVSNKDQIKTGFKNHEDFQCDRSLVESLYILCNLDDVHPMHRYWNLAKILRCHTTVRLAANIAAANWKGNFVQVCKQLENLCPLTYCALCLYLPTLQRRALQVLSAAYNSKQLTVPLSAIRRWLRFDSDSNAISVCAHYGLAAKEGAVRFTKGDFKADVATHQPTRLLLLDQKLDLSAKHVFTYLSKDYTYVA